MDKKSYRLCCRCVVTAPAANVAITDTLTSSTNSSLALHYQTMSSYLARVATFVNIASLRTPTNDQPRES